MTHETSSLTAVNYVSLSQNAAKTQNSAIKVYMAVSYSECCLNLVNIEKSVSVYVVSVCRGSEVTLIYGIYTIYNTHNKNVQQ